MTTDSTPSRPTTRLDAPARRESILDAAELLFVQAGFHATGTRDLAKACGVTEPVLYRHFPSKESLFIEVVTRMLDQGIQDLAASDRPEHQERAMRRMMESLLLIDTAADVEKITGLVGARRTALDSAFAAATGKRGEEELCRRLGEVVLERISQD